jgi:hypothetical protein
MFSIVIFPSDSNENARGQSLGLGLVLYTTPDRLLCQTAKVPCTAFPIQLAVWCD